MAWQDFAIAIFSNQKMVNEAMKKLSSISIKPFALILFIASLALPAHQANAQEVDIYQPEINEEAIDEVRAVKSTEYTEISTSLGYVSYTDPETWNNNTSYSVAFRDVSKGIYETTYIEFEMAETLSATSDIDGFRRNSSYQKLGFGVIGNESNAPTTFFSSFGLGFIRTKHYVRGVNAWRYPESDEIYDDTIIYQNSGLVISDDAGVYVHFGLGIKIKNRHKLSFYIDPIIEGALSARSDVHDANNNEGLYYYGSIPRQIVNGMAGFRYSYIFPKSWARTSFEYRPLNPYDEE